MPTITLTTDFGTTDAYVGVMKGVILSIAPGTNIVDLSHGIPPQDTLAAALLLESAAECFPAGTIHVAVVDPGVGSDRAPIAVLTERYFFVGPDNGVFTAALASSSSVVAVKLDNPQYHRQPVCPTFHGRDIFAPAAAHLAKGTPLSNLGSPLTDLTQIERPTPNTIGDTLELHVIYVDHFGNLVTDLTPQRYNQWRENHLDNDTPITIRLGDHRIDRISQTFSDTDIGQPVAYFGSSQRLEIAIRNGHAANALDAAIGHAVRITPQQA